MKNHVLSNHIIEQECTGCSICAAVCPFGAIKIEQSNDGFYEPVIDEQLCEDCGICKETCYKFDEIIRKSDDKEPLVYSAINTNKKELLSSTSGGVSIELMKACIDNGYKVLGVSYDYTNKIALTKIASSIDELEQFKGSKYFQSYTLEAIKKVLKDKNKQKYAIFATPCQIYSISRYVDLHKDLKDNWLLIDIFCYGCPSLNLWIKYLEYIKKKFSLKRIDKIQFRSKPEGWHKFNITFISDDNIYHSSISDPFYEVFFKKNALNEACYNCKLRSTIAYTDIRMGDFWGDEYSKNIDGVSAVVINTDRGKALFDSVKEKFEIKRHTLAEVIPFQSYGKKHKLNKKKRRYTLDLLSSDHSIEQISKRRN